MLAGGKEGEGMERDARKMLSILEANAHVNSKLKVVPEGEHREAFWNVEFKEGLEFLIN